MNKINIPNGGVGVFAEYKEQVISEYRNNPFIEALPNILSREEVIDQLAVYPPYNPNERLLDARYRVHIVQRLFQCFQPLGIHLDLESRISRILRQGYLARNPFRAEYIKDTNKRYKMTENLRSELSNNDLFRTTASGITIIGCSGLGKTTAINRILSFMPQIIVHKKYRDLKFSMYQLTWLKLDCPFDGSLKGLCLEFFSKVDSLLGTNYFIKYGSAKRTVDTLLSVIAQIARNTGLGLLIIDEIQHLSAAKSGGSEKMLNFFVTLVNTVGVPVIMIGTTKAIPILQSEFRQARRGSGQGDIIWERMKKDESWDLLMEAIWGYQWTKKETNLSDEIKNIIYEESQGIIDIAVKLYAMSQIRAIMTGKEEVSINLIKQVSNENFKLVKPMLDALKSNDIRRIAKYEDICTLDFEHFLNNEQQSININSRIIEFQNAKRVQEEEENLSIKEQAVTKLLELGIEPKAVQKTIEKVLKDKSLKMSVKEIILKSLQLLSEREDSNKKNMKSCKGKDENDLRVILQAGLEKNLSAYEAIKCSGYIKPDIILHTEVI